jgi:type I restriction enzyme S subunit
MTNPSTHHPQRDKQTPPFEKGGQGGFAVQAGFTLPAQIPHLDLIATAPQGVKRLRELILELAVCGKLVPQDPNDEPASELLKRIQAEKAKLVTEGKNRCSTSVSELSDKYVPYSIPISWSWVRFGEIMLSRDGERIPVSKDERNCRAKLYDYYGASGVIDKIDNYLFDKPLLLIGEDGANLINRSTPIAFIARGHYWVNNHAHVLDGITEHFLRYIELHINAIDLKPYVTGTAQPKMNQAKMNGIPIALPPEAEQHRIVSKVDELMALCDRLEAQQADAVSAHTTLVKTLLDTLTQSGPGNTSADDFTANWQRLAQHFDTLFTTEASIAALKQTLLQLAVMGKLVPQDPNDEPASELLKRIQAEKAMLVAEGKIKKDKPLPAIDEDEKPFVLPVGWEWVRFAEVTKVCSELVKPEEFMDSLQVAPDCIEKGTGKLLARRTVRESGVRGPNQRFYSGQLLYSKIRPSLSKAVLVDFDGLCSADMYPLARMFHKPFVHP